MLDIDGSRRRQLFGGSYLFWARRWLQLKAFNNITYGKSLERGGVESLITSQSCGGLNGKKDYSIFFAFYFALLFWSVIRCKASRSKRFQWKRVCVRSLLIFATSLEDSGSVDTIAGWGFLHVLYPPPSVARRSKNSWPHLHAKKKKYIYKSWPCHVRASSLCRHKVFFLSFSLLSLTAKVNNNNSNSISNFGRSGKNTIFGACATFGRFSAIVSIIKISFMPYGRFAISAQFGSAWRVWLTK